MQFKSFKIRKTIRLLICTIYILNHDAMQYVYYFLYYSKFIITKGFIRRDGVSAFQTEHL